MKNKSVIIIAVLGLLFLSSCKQEKEVDAVPADVRIVGAMKDAMWNGELSSKIDLDTISTKENLYGLGPVAQMRGEIIILEGKSYVSKVVSETEMEVNETFDVGAPFFVYSNVTDWKEVKVPAAVSDLKSLEMFIAEEMKDYDQPFAFKVSGEINKAMIHVQNLPPGSIVSSPEEAHIGQQSYRIDNKIVDMVGFYSKNQKGVFTHHDSNMHLHLITRDRQTMGHLDKISFKDVVLYLPRD